MTDRYGRTIEYMRVSVTDRCDLRCRYCMPEGCVKVPMSQILTYEQIIRICRLAAELGIRKIRITGGEPFVRPGCVDLIRAVKRVPGIDEVCVTTNGQTLSGYISELKEIGIDGINISLDSLDRDRFRYITGRGELEKTLKAIELAADSGIKTKINSLVIKDFNFDEVSELAGFAFDRGIDLRFIELMPIGTADPGKGVPNAEVLRKLKGKWPELSPDKRTRGSGPAVYYSRPGIGGSIGFISAMHEPFCRGCNRVRLTSQGQLKPCLCYEKGTELKPYLEKSDAELKAAIAEAIYNKPEAHCFNNDSEHTEHRMMSQIGG